MILKEVGKKHSLDKYQQYGHAAEKQMAFYLKRAFQDNEEIQVINDLRLEMDGDVAQIDHLVIHRFGFFIIESKSVTAHVSVNEYGEWARQFSSYTKGMPSPVQQAKRQADFLLKLLLGKADDLLRKRRLFRSPLSEFKFDVLVAISDDGVITRNGDAEFPEVYKADQITDAIQACRVRYVKENKNLLSSKVNCQLADSSINNIAQYLLSSHKPRQSQSPIVIADRPADTRHHDQQSPNEESSESPQSVVASCGKCGSSHVAITYGKYGYYFKCRDCSGNTAIKLSCKGSNCQPKIQKKKNDFYKVCSACRTIEPYFTNPLEVEGVN